MARFSKRTLRILGDEFAGSWTLATITDLFDDASVELGDAAAASGVSGQRRGLATRYISSLDLDQPGDVAKLVEVVNHVLFEMTHRPETEPLAEEFTNRFIDQLRRDGFALDERSQIVGSAQVQFASQLLSSLPDASAIRDHLRRLNDSIETDPRLAVSVAKELVESTAKLVLRSREIPYTKSDDVPQLVARAQEALRLNASGVEGTAEEGKALRRILQSLTSLTQGITELRNQVGTGHGRASVPTWVRPRHARLAAGASQTWCQLMLETLEDRDAPWRATDSPRATPP